MTDREAEAGLRKAMQHNNRALTYAEFVRRAVSAAMAAVVPGTQRKRTKEWAALRSKGFSAAIRALKRASR